ncbi:MAG: CaiB/BaiF CoA-transferase family protein [Candidatus Nanopelagicales bacterium]|nr:CaiB/BaiF CoA-transferase family protein [Candidatus Nanopelagicales bacterium]
MSAPLAGVRVLDLTRLLPGNYATLILAGLGADVIKIEDPGSGDGTRFVPPWTPAGESGAHAVLNRGKRSVGVDLKVPAGRELFLELVGQSQVMIDSFRPGVLDRLDLGSDVLAGANPSLVHVTIDAFGSGGPLEHVPAHDLNTAGFAGIIGLARDRDGRPAMPSMPVVDHLSGLQAVIAVLVGLRVGERDGYRAEVAMVDAAASILTLAGGYFAATGQSPPAPETLSGQLACYSLYECRDGRWITVGGLESKFFSRMLALMGLEDLVGQQYEPGTQEDLRETLTERFRSRDRDEWLELLMIEDTCVGPVNDVGEALTESNLRDRGIVSDIEFRDGTRAPAVRSVPWLAHAGPIGRIGHDRPDVPDHSIRQPAPRLGEHTEAILRSVGVDADRIAQLAAEGAISAK